MTPIHHSHCPVCNSSSINPLLTVKDHSVSNEAFVIWQCSECTLRFTQDAPDAESITRYYNSAEYISHSNTSKGYLNKLYQLVRKVTLNQKAALVISKTKPQGKILDIGAGIGAFIHVMKEKGWEVKGIEPDQGARAKAKSLFQLVLDDTESMETLIGGQFDAISLWHVLEHVHELHNYIEKLKELLKRDGKIFIAVPNYQSLDADVYRPYWAAYDVPRHLYHFSPRSMEALMKRHGLNIIEKKPMWYDSFYISFLSSKYHKGKTEWISAGFAGLRSNLKALFNKERCSSIIYIIEQRGS